jgi:hypothetical protein
MEEVPNMGVENVRTAQEVEAFRKPRKEAVQICTGVAEKHKKLQDRYQFVWVWSGRLAQLGFASGIGLLLWFAISNT